MSLREHVCAPAASGTVLVLVKGVASADAKNFDCLFSSFSLDMRKQAKKKTLSRASFSFLR